MTDQYTFITEDGLKRLKEELIEFKTNKRKEIAERIREAKELGDLSENAEYTEAKEEQAFIEGKIIELEHIIKNARLIKSEKASDIVKIGSRIKVKFDGKEAEYIIVGSNEANPSKGRISNESPIGKAFLNKRVGDVVSVDVPQGKKELKIISIN